MTIWGEKTYVPVIMGASGITTEQAKTCLYYSIATYLIPDKINKIPLLVIMGPHGTGKTCLLTQLSELVNEPNIIGAQSIPTMRDELAGCTTAVIDEGDKADERYLIKRYDKKTSDVTVNRSAKGGWRADKISIFGSTIIVRRTPFQDPATTSRSLIVRTKFRCGRYQNIALRQARVNLGKVADKIKLDNLQKTNDRIADNWVALRKIGEYLKDSEWLKYSDIEIEKNRKALRGSQNYEPELALLLVFKEMMLGQEAFNSEDVLMSAIKLNLKTEFDLHLKNIQIQEMCRALGFKVVSHSGYPKVKCNRELLNTLLKEREL